MTVTTAACTQRLINERASISPTSTLQPRPRLHESSCAFPSNARPLCMYACTATIFYRLKFSCCTAAATFLQYRHLLCAFPKTTSQSFIGAYRRPSNSNHPLTLTSNAVTLSRLMPPVTFSPLRSKKLRAVARNMWICTGGRREI